MSRQRDVRRHAEKVRREAQAALGPGQVRADDPLARYVGDSVGFMRALVNPETDEPFEVYEAEARFLREAFDTDGGAPYPELVYSCPKKSSLRVRNARDVFYSDAEVEAVRRELPADLRNLWTVAAWTGWRRNELFHLQWSQVDFHAGVVRLGVGTTKNDEGREVPFDAVPELVAAFEAQRDCTRDVERRLGQICPHVFHRNGKPIRRIDVARQSACRRAGVIGKDDRPKVLHDLRRTAARNLTRAGVPRHVAMRILGLKTESMWRRYSIIETEDLRHGLAKVLAFRTRDRRAANEA